MRAAEFDVVAIGNAIVDILQECSEDFLAATGLPKGRMTLVDTSAAIAGVRKNANVRMEVAGGSAANTAVGVASFGGRAAFMGRVGADMYGQIFRHDIRGTGVHFEDAATAIPGMETSHSLILMTPDGQRTMMTFLGCSSEFNDSVLDAGIIRRSRFVYLEGYLVDRPKAKAAFHEAAEIARAAGRSVVVSLSDAACVGRHRADFLTVIRAGKSTVICNESELSALYEMQNLDDALRKVGTDTALAVVTRSDKGSVIVENGSPRQIPAERVRKVVDATGAGDLFAAGFLYGLARGFDHERAGRLASFAASEIIAQVGPRPQGRLSQAARMRGLIG